MAGLWTGGTEDMVEMLGTYATTSRQQITVRRTPREGNGNVGQGPWRQVQRMGNPLINELIKDALEQLGGA